MKPARLLRCAAPVVAFTPVVTFTGIEHVVGEVVASEVLLLPRSVAMMVIELIETAAERGRDRELVWSGMTIATLWLSAKKGNPGRHT